jgi:hypothetical protein
MRHEVLHGMGVDTGMVPPITGAPRNLYVRIEGSDMVAADRIRYYVWFSLEPALPPVLEFDVEYLPGIVALMPAVTNSWPDTVSRNTPDGAVDCTWYEVEIPAPAIGLCLRPSSEVLLGREDVPIVVPPIALTVGETVYTPTDGWSTTGLGFDVQTSNGIIVDWRPTP